MARADALSLATQADVEGHPHLIDDIGLTRQQVEEEIAKLTFWQRQAHSGRMGPLGKAASWPPSDEPGLNAVL